MLNIDDYWLHTPSPVVKKTVVEKQVVNISLNITEKNIICFRGMFIDLNFITDIKVKNEKLILKRVDGDEIKFSRYKNDLSYIDVPKSLLNKRFKSREHVEQILGELNFSFGIGSAESYVNWDYEYFIYNKFLTEFNSIKSKKEFDDSCLYIIQKWSKLKGQDGPIINLGYRVKELILNYYNENKDNIFVYEDIYKTFGINISTIAKIIGRNDYFINKKGRIELSE